MDNPPISELFAPLALKAFRRASQGVPAYRDILSDTPIIPENITSSEAFRKLPILNKQSTFQKFPIEELCIDGEIGDLASVLTSSGHSGVFAFGLNEANVSAAEWTDGALDLIFSIRSRKTLLVNCLPMGVKVHTNVCTLAETSVRADMAVALIKEFHRHFEQIIIVGDPGFVKHLLEVGLESDVPWQALRVHIILGEEILPENARTYFEGILGIDPASPESGVIASSMGIGEVGLNLFFEAPSEAPLIPLRRLLHQDGDLRAAILGSAESLPSLFTYDPRRIFVEFDSDERLILTTLDPQVRLPLIRYAPGDSGNWLRLPKHTRPIIETAGLSWDALHAVPIVTIQGRGKYAMSGGQKVYPEAVKEGIYADHSLARKTTANFRLVAGEKAAVVRIQLSPKATASSDLESQFASAISRYVSAPFTVSCEPYSGFGSGMSLNYERKFDYLGA